jgi:CRISPR-associated endoribonuclease Cas6
MESLRENQPRFPLYYNHDLQGFIYQIHGKPELISLAYDTGLGSKNSQGFGMFEILLKKVK